jgi:peptidoglycan/LPS O-acetylase OafA/YrhL
MFSETKYRRDIQVLRGLAVLAVVLFHANENYFPLGYLGVDVFFVISGFVVTPLILRIFTDQTNGGGRISNLRYFFKRRFYRLAPALAVTLIISAISIFLLGSISDHQRFARQGIATLHLVGNVGAYKYSGGDYFASNPNPLVHTWSLSVEEQIYIFLPLILIVILHNRRRLKKITAVVLGCISAISFISFLFPVILQPLYSRAGIAEASQFSFFSPVDRIWQFGLGGLVFFLLDGSYNRIKDMPKSINSAAVIAIAIILLGPIHIGLRSSSIFTSLFAVFVIIFKSLDVLPEFLIKKLGWLGDRSYSIYLVHMPLVYIAKYSPAFQIGNGENQIVPSTIALVVSILLGALSYSKIENRYRDRGKSDHTSLRMIAVSLLLTFAIPLTLFASIDYGQKKRYWGLDRNIPQPSYAGFLDPNCERDSGNGQPCTYANKGATKSVLLLGDSHAGHISQAVIDAAKHVNWNSVIWTHSGCAFQVLDQEKKVRDSCIKNNRQAVEWILRNTPDLIIVSQLISSESNLSDLENALSAIHSIVPNILLIENTPKFPDGKDFMVSRSLLMSPYEPPKSFLLTEMESNSKYSSNQLAMWARGNGISTMDFTPLFCDKKICSRFSNGLWLYRDTGHLSVDGAELTIPQIENFLKRF